MDEIPVEVLGYSLLNKCKCCLGDDHLRGMWVEHCEDGRKEIYGEMLNECFGVSDNLQCNMHTDHICISCVCRLRNAVDFKREVLVCAQLRLEHYINESNPVKVEVEECEDDENGVELDEVSDHDPDSGCAEEQEFEDVEYLELDDADNNEVKPTIQTFPVGFDVSGPDKPGIQESDEPKHKWPKKRTQLEKLQIYRKYTRDEMVQALEAVKNESHSLAEAAREFKVPRKTLANKLLDAERRKDDSDCENQYKYIKKEKHFQFISEVKKIITYTNAIPFKTKASRYFCHYCSTDGPCFEDPDELRAHTRTEHVDDKTRSIEIILRPQYNEVIKMDIDSLHCTVCCIVIPSWANMFKHFEEVHEIELDEAYTKVIPYILKRDLSCVLCNDSFPNFHHLDGHMNIHYANYICSECGDTFLSASRYTKHLKVHNTGQFPCEGCGKIFTLEKYRRKHFERLHKHELKIKCLYCPEKFYGTFQRHLHLVEKHKEKIRITTCELCGMRFEWRQYYVAHMRRKHKLKMS